MEGESKRKKGKMEKGIKKGEREGLKGKGHCLQGCLKDEPSGDLPEPPSRLQAVGSSRRLSPGPSRTLSTGGRRGVLCSSSRPGAGRWRRTASPPPSSECPWSPRSARRTALSTAGRAPREGISQGQQPGAAARGIIQGTGTCCLPLWGRILDTAEAASPEGFKHGVGTAVWGRGSVGKGVALG